MPATIPAHQAVRARLRDAAGHAAELSRKLEDIVAVKSRQPSGNFHGKIDHSQPPWHAPAAHAIMDLHALTRQMEAELRSELGFPSRPRGGSDQNTQAALDAVLRLAESADDWLARLYARELGRWSRKASVALGETEIPKRLPRIPGASEPKCPFCENHTLRSLPLAGDIFCINPVCTDENKKRPRARMEYSKDAGDWVMVWQDGIAGVPA